MSGPPEVLVRAYHAARAARIDADRCEIHPRAYRGVDRCFRRVRAEVREAHDLAMVHLTAIVPSFIARPIAVDLDAPFPERWRGERVWRVGWNRKPAVVGALRRVGGWHRVSLVSRGVVVTRPLGGSDRIRHVLSLPARPFAPRRGDSGGPILHMERDAAMLIGVLSGVADGEPHDWTAGVHASVAAPDNASFIWRVLADQSALQSTGRSVATSSRTHQSPVSRFSSGVVNR